MDSEEVFLNHKIGNIVISRIGIWEGEFSKWVGTLVY